MGWGGSDPFFPTDLNTLEPAGGKCRKGKECHLVADTRKNGDISQTGYGRKLVGFKKRSGIKLFFPPKYENRSLFSVNLKQTSNLNF